ncbi:MAG: hypothetical protein JRD47_04725 [Deltaproteobacteria bacterium]|nr:hypothetical protein [Deltaproteobacteria bacterium]
MRITSYVSLNVTQKTDKRASKMNKIFLFDDLDLAGSCLAWNLIADRAAVVSRNIMVGCKETDSPLRGKK